MSENKEYYSRQLETGAVHVSEEVVLAIAAQAVQEVEGVVGLSASFSNELQERLGKKTVKEIHLTQLEDAVAIDCSVIVLYGSSMQELGAAIQNAVAQAVESMTGLRVGAVNVNIAGISMKKP